ncbi:hybrid sensor histidine kinase/response regulator [Sneathiella glossodoripedis]|uniref:hybrid sensor histidine kinase/response regulator n=1 Tax=Sneathiella glossodoripedis TaxID=418853 RepID=UPI00046FD447|nr:PAS domain S-box protein [Sneathiella glossodoripedis]
MGDISPVNNKHNRDKSKRVDAGQGADDAIFRALLENAAIAMVVTRNDIFLYANEFALELYGMKDQGMVGHHVHEFHEDLEGLLEFQKKLADGEKVMNHRLEVVTPQGARKTILFTSTRGMYQGEPANFSVLQDYTEFVQSQLVYEQQEQQLLKLLELIPDALIVQSEGTLLYVNQGAVNLFGAKNAHEMLGRSSLDLAAPSYRDKILELRFEVEQHGSKVDLETRHVRRDGTEFPSQMYAQPVLWNGRPGTLSIVRDVSQEVDYLARLHQKDREMELAQQLGRVGHWRIKIDNLDVEWSRSLYEMHGLELDDTDLDMELASSMVVEEDRALMEEAINNCLRTRSQQSYEVRLRTPQNEIRYMVGIVQPDVIEDGLVKSVFGFAQNVTQRRELEERLRQSQKMEAIGQLTGGIAHDFNNLLAVIRGNAELLLEPDTLKGEARPKALKNIITASDRGADLTKNMLAFARDQQLNPVVSTLDTPVRNTVSMLQRTIGEEIEIALKIGRKLWPCLVDTGQVENALLNLVVNARDAMPKGGRLTISLKNHVQKTPRQFQEDEMPSGDYVMLSVRDTGMGIDREKLKQVFDPFFTTKEVGKGTGLGLSMVYGFIRQSSGFVSISSTKGKGTRVDIYLPRVGIE